MRRLLALIAVLSLVGACAPDDPPETAPDIAPAGQQLRWEQLAPVPTPRTEVAATARRGRIFVVGGFAEDRGTVATVEIYDISSDSWRTGPRLPLAVNHAMSATLDGVVYVVGGYIGGGRSTRRAFAFRDGRWRELPRMPRVRAAGGLVAVRGRLFVVGGVGANGVADSTMVFDPDDRRWRVRAGVPTQRQHLGAAGARRRVWVVAGRTGGLDSNMDTFERYSPSAGNWRRLPDIPTARGGLAAAATRNGFIVAAGGEAPNRTFDEVEAYNIGRRRWRSLPPMPTARHGLGVVAVGNTIYVLAGGPQPGLTYSDANEAIDLSSL
ncbi:MAG: Kelch repeat-containing protein [Actinomycetota bacterium]